MDPWYYITLLYFYSKQCILKDNYIQLKSTKYSKQLLFFCSKTCPLYTKNCAKDVKFIITFNIYNNLKR